MIRTKANDANRLPSVREVRLMFIMHCIMFDCTSTLKIFSWNCILHNKLHSNIDYSRISPMVCPNEAYIARVFLMKRCLNLKDKINILWPFGLLWYWPLYWPVFTYRLFQLSSTNFYNKPLLWDKTNQMKLMKSCFLVLMKKSLDKIIINKKYVMCVVHMCQEEKFYL